VDHDGELRRLVLDALENRFLFRREQAWVADLPEGVLNQRQATSVVAELRPDTLEHLLFRHLDSKEADRGIVAFFLEALRILDCGLHSNHGLAVRGPRTQ